VTRSGALADRIGQLTGLPVREARVVGAQHGYQHLMLTLSGGRRAFAKAATSPAQRGVSPAAEVAAAFAAEANGLRWLAEAAAVPVPEVLAVGPEALVIAMLPPGPATPATAFQFGTDLARLHAVGADRFGAPWPGFIASLPLDNTPDPPDTTDSRDTTDSPHTTDSPYAADLPDIADPPGTTDPQRGADWPHWYARRRLLPFLTRAVDAGALQSQDARLVEEVIDRIGSLAGPAEPPSRIHGDCWAGNVLWSGGRGWLIDPAAHGGHRETDLAMLALFGAPSLDRILAGYNDTVPLAAGWRSRIPLHQLHPLLVHACLFGASYREEVRSAARAALAI